jgi:serine/threonine protein kinase
MEHCAGGDLFSYIDKRSFKLAEPRAAQIIHKLSTAIFYLHSYGITHRDLKTENIMMTDNSETADIKLLDFGLSKIIGPNECCTEPFGTLVIFLNILFLNFLIIKKKFVI